MLIGTHTTGEQNYLMIASCCLPLDNGGPVDESKQETEDSKAPAIRFDEDKKELGGHGLANSAVGKLEIKIKIKFEGEVNR